VENSSEYFKEQDRIAKKQEECRITVIEILEL